MILQIHGGPHAAYGNTFTHEFQWMARPRACAVLYTNPRGSSNYGQDFGNVIQFGDQDDYKDLMVGVDEVIKKGYIDIERLGVTGGAAADCRPTGR